MHNEYFSLYTCMYDLVVATQHERPIIFDAALPMDVVPSISLVG